jgi:dienelactone hydrolase
VYFRHSKSSGQDERHLEETVEMQEYQIQYRIRELESVVNHLRTTYGIACDKKIVGGFDMGGATALLAAEKLGAVGVISLDGQFALADRFRFPRSIFEDGRVVNVPSAFMLSDEWQVWNRAVTDNTKSLSERCPDSKLITVKQTKHNNFIECMYWIPQIFLIFLRLSGIIHRRASPRKSYRRTVKWLVALVQQYTSDQAKTRSYSS